MPVSKQAIIIGALVIVAILFIAVYYLFATTGTTGTTVPAAVNTPAASATTAPTATAPTASAQSASAPTTAVPTKVLVPVPPPATAVPTTTLVRVQPPTTVIAPVIAPVVAPAVAPVAPKPVIKVFNGCDGANIVLSCPTGTVVSGGSLAYGRWNNTICPHPTVNAKTPIKSKIYMMPAAYLGKQTATMSGMMNTIVKEDPYPGVYKHISGSYQCK
jgi:hypothetical protein